MTITGLSHSFKVTSTEGLFLVGNQCTKINDKHNICLISHKNLYKILKN